MFQELQGEEVGARALVCLEVVSKGVGQLLSGYPLLGFVGQGCVWGGCDGGVMEEVLVEFSKL